MKKFLIAAAALAALPAIANTYNYTATVADDFGNVRQSFTSIAFNDTAMTLTGAVTVNNAVLGTNGLTLQCCSPVGNFPQMALPVIAGPVAVGTYSFNIDLSQASSWDASFLSANGGTPSSALSALLTGIGQSRAGMEAWTNATSGRVGRLVAAPVPEPTTYGMMALGLGLLALRRRTQQA